MRWAYVLPVLLSLCTIAMAEEDPAEGRVGLRVTTLSSEAYVGERVFVELWVAVDDVWFREHAVQAFTRKLDLPVKVDAPWLRTREGSSPWVLDDTDQSSTVAVNDLVVAACVEDLPMVHGENAHVLRWSRILEKPGKLSLAGTRLRFTWATAFDMDALGDLHPRDPREFVLPVEDATVSVRPLPEAGRPASFSGLVGRTRVTTSISSDEVKVGESLQFAMRVESDGDLVDCSPPDLAGFEGLLHVKGRIDTLEPGARTFTWEIAPLAATVRSIPPVAYSWFLPGEEPGYVTFQTDALPLAVLGGDAPTGAGTVQAPVNATETTSGDSTATGVLAVGLLIVLAVVIAAFLILRKMFKINKLQTDEEPLSRFRSDLVEGNKEPLEALSAYLAARLGLPQPALVGGALDRWLVEAGIPEPEAKRAADLLESLRKAQYGGDAVPEAVAAALALVEDLEAGFREAEPTS